MPDLSDIEAARTVKMLFLGNSGAGKTGALASLASEGYNLRILDFDNGLPILRDLLLNAEKFKYTHDAITRVKSLTLTDKKRTQDGKVFAAEASAWPRTLATLTRWKNDKEDLGPLTSWGEQDVLVIDTLSGLCDIVYNFVLAMNGKLIEQPRGNAQRRLVWHAQDLVEDLLAMLASTEIKCNVIVSSHVKYVDKIGSVRENEEQIIPKEGFPNALGGSLSPRIPRAFNHSLLAEKIGLSHFILTKTAGNINLKTAAPSVAKDQYKLETGLAEYFKAVRGV